MKSKLFYNYCLAGLAIAGLCTGLILNVSIRNRETLRLDLGKGSITTLSAKTKDQLAKLQSPVKITYYMTERKRMPTAMRDVGAEVQALLREMKKFGGKNFTYEIVYPEDTPQASRTVGRFHISSFQFKTILKDEYSVNTVWSGILIEYKGQSRSIPYITGEHLHFVEDSITTHLRQIETGYKPFMAVYGATGGSYNEVYKTITGFNFGEVKPFSFGKGGGLPNDADMAFIFQPENLTKDDLESIKSFMHDGKDVIITFSPCEISPAPGRYRYRLSPKSAGALEEYLSDLGVRFEDKIVIEQKEFKNKPFMPTILGFQINFDGMKLQRGGTLFYPYCAPIISDKAKLRKSGFATDALIYSSKDSWAVPYSPDKDSYFDDSAFSTKPANSADVQTLAVCLTSDKAWEGRLFLYSSGYFFSDQVSALGANQLYLKNLLLTYAQPEVMNSIHASSERLPTIAPQTSAVRLLWRVIAIFVIPSIWLVLLLIKMLKHQFGGATLKKSDLQMFGLMSAAVIALMLLLAGVRHLGNVSLDITRGKTNSLSPLTVKWINDNVKEAVTVRYFTSPASDMPLELRSMVSEVEAKLNAIASSSNGKISFKEETLSFDDNSPAQTERLKKLGVKPFKMKVISNDRYAEKMVYSGLVFEKAGGAIETEPMLTKNNVSRLEFVVVSSVKRLIENARPSIAFVGDLPHFSAGEFWEMQQIEMQTQPKSEDVYGRCIELLRNEGYTVNVYDSKSSNIQFSEDLLIYLQPWIISDEMKKEFNRFLGSGKNAIVACQHYFMQARKYSGRGYAAVYWPQPQFSRINELLSPYGIELVPEVFFDQSKASIETNEQIRWGTYKRRDKRAPDAQPFIVRAVPADYDKQSSITARLSDILFIWGNRLRMIKNTFPPSLQWRTLISSSEDCWALDWKGGFLSEQILQGGEYFDRRQPLCVMIEGLFPALYKNNPASAPGKLLLAGSSKIFDNNQLDTTRYDNERFILNSVAELTYGKELAKIQASSAEESKGFGYVEPAKKLLWRALILGFVPFCLVIYGLRRFRKRRSPKTIYL